MAYNPRRPKPSRWLPLLRALRFLWWCTKPVRWIVWAWFDPGPDHHYAWYGAVEPNDRPRKPKL